MQCFDYPIDVNELISKKRKIKRMFKENDDAYFLKKRIAVLGGSTTNEIVDQLELFLLNEGIEAEFYQSEYAQYWNDAVYGNDLLNEFKPDLIYIHTNWRNISKFPSVNQEESDIKKLVDEEFNRFREMWNELFVKFNCPIIQNNFERPNYRLLGNADISNIHGRSNYIHRLNSALYDYANTHTGLYINDIDYIASDYGITKWNNSKVWSMYKYAMPIDAIPYLAHSISNIIKSLYGKNKKTIVLDMDNTLWGGVIGDDGVEGISIGPETAEGQIYLEFQQYLKELKQIGVLLAIDSKNNEDVALEGLKQDNSFLCPEDFVSIKCNWQPKDENIKEISEELSLSTESFVFVDDNPSERDIVKNQLPDVSVLDVDEVEDFIKAIDNSGYFETIQLSSEDENKTNLYHARAQAKRLEKQYASYNDFLSSLNMTALISQFRKEDILRIVQLINKTNQFNLTTLRLTENEVLAMSQNNNYICITGRLKDKFGDNGIVSIVIGEKVEKQLHIRLWLMSCRVLKRGMEDLMMNQIVLCAKKQKLDEIVGYYVKSAKNQMVKDFYLSYGYTMDNSSADSTIWRIKLDDYVDKKTCITVVE